MDNQDRAESARNVLAYFCELVSSDEDIKTLSVDLICNIKHLLASEGIDYLSVLNTADGHFEAETTAVERPQEGGHDE